MAVSRVFQEVNEDVREKIQRLQPRKLTRMSKWDMLENLKVSLRPLPDDFFDKIGEVTDLGELQTGLISLGIKTAKHVAGKFLLTALQSEVLRRKGAGASLTKKGEAQEERTGEYLGNGRYLVAYGGGTDYIMKTYLSGEARRYIDLYWLNGASIAMERLGGIGTPTQIFDYRRGDEEFTYYIKDSQNSTDIAIAQRYVQPLVERTKQLGRARQIADACKVVDGYKSTIIKMFRRGVIDDDPFGIIGNYGVDFKTQGVHIFDFGDLSTDVHTAGDFITKLPRFNGLLAEYFGAILPELGNYYTTVEFKPDDFRDNGQSSFGLDYAKQPEACRITFPMPKGETRAYFARDRSETRTKQS